MEIFPLNHMNIIKLVHFLPSTPFSVRIMSLKKYFQKKKWLSLNDHMFPGLRPKTRSWWKLSFAVIVSFLFAENKVLSSMYFKCIQIGNLWDYQMRFALRQKSNAQKTLQVAPDYTIQLYGVSFLQLNNIFW